LLSLPVGVKQKSKTMSTQKHFLPNIAICIVMDLVGMLTYTFPVLGEFADIIWAPFSAFVFLKLFGGRMGVFGSAFNFLEEIIPFTDAIPTFTIAWFIRKNAIDKSFVVKR
jgi:hypothetical protein